MARVRASLPMLNNFFYSHSTWTVMAVVCGTLLAAALAGLAVFHRLVHWHAREEDTTMTGLSYAIAGGIYAVLIAFVAVGVYGTMDRAETTATQEANALTGLAFDTAGLPAEQGQSLRADIDAYIEIVVHKEWPSQQAWQMSEHNFEAGWAQLKLINRHLGAYQPDTPGRTIVKQAMSREINALVGARRSRLLAANAHLPEAIWQMMLCGCVLTVVYVYLFGPHHLGIHMAVTGLTAVSIGLVFTLIIALDYPFRGDLSVGNEAYLSVRETVASLFEPGGHGEGREPSPVVPEAPKVGGHE